MSFRVIGLDPTPFRHLFGLSDEALAAKGVKRYVVDAKPGFPDRVEVRDLDPGDTALLLNYTHQPADTPYRSSHAIFIREGAEQAFEGTGSLPELMLVRPLSLRAFDADHMMIDADLAEGSVAQPVIKRFLANADVSYIHVHTAKRGCYLARIDRL